MLQAARPLGSTGRVCGKQRHPEAGQELARPPTLEMKYVVALPGPASSIASAAGDVPSAPASEKGDELDVLLHPTHRRLPARTSQRKTPFSAVRSSATRNASTPINTLIPTFPVSR